MSHVGKIWFFSPFFDFKELISINRYKTETKPNFLWSLLSKNETAEVYNSKIMKRSLQAQYHALFDFYIINPLFMDFLYDYIYIKRPRSSYITLFLKNIFIPACFPLDNT